LGARVSNLISNPLSAAVRSGKVQAFEKNLLVDQINQQINQQNIAPYVTANLNLWPQTLAVIANPARLAKLTPQQRGWLQQAAGDAAARSTGMVNTDQHLMEILCKSGARFANASAADLAGLRTAFAPVYASLSQYPQTQTFIAQIQQLKQQTPPGPRWSSHPDAPVPSRPPRRHPAPSPPLRHTPGAPPPRSPGHGRRTVTRVLSSSRRARTPVKTPQTTGAAPTPSNSGRGAFGSLRSLAPRQAPMS
jgi:Bacterial extracellular solute-binding protein, family 7